LLSLGSPTRDQRTQSVKQLLQRHAAEGGDYLLYIVNVVERSWFHNFDPKQNDSTWNRFTLHLQGIRKPELEKMWEL
jgi:hypothetical protein